MLQTDVVSAIQGISKFDPDLPNDFIQQTKAKVDTATVKVNRYELELENGQQRSMSTTADYQR